MEARSHSYIDDLVGFAIPTAVVLAMTNGNIGTLLRLRGLVTPYIAWISALGFCVVADRMCAAWQGRAPAVGLHKPLGSGA